MARMRVFIVFALAITVGGVFAFATYNYVQKAPGKTVDDADHAGRGRRRRPRHRRRDRRDDIRIDRMAGQRRCRPTRSATRTKSSAAG